MAKLSNEVWCCFDKDRKQHTFATKKELERYIAENGALAFGPNGTKFIPPKRKGVLK